MPTPSSRTPVRIARGSYSNLNSSISDLGDGEIVYAEDQDKLYVKEGSNLVGLTHSPGNIPQLAKTANYTLAATDVGKHILCNTASITITIVPANLSVGDVFSIVNNTSGNVSIAHTGGTMYNSSDQATGTRTLASRGLATLIVASSTVVYVSGAGVS